RIISNSCAPSEFTLRRNNMMGFRCFLAVVLGLLLGSSLFAQSSGERIQSDPSGEWVLTTIVYGENLSERLKLTAEKDQLRGTLFRRTAPIGIRAASFSPHLFEHVRARAAHLAGRHGAHHERGCRRHG